MKEWAGLGVGVGAVHGVGSGLAHAALLALDAFNALAAFGRSATGGN